MARSDYRTLGLLNRWPVVMAEDVFRFNQIGGQGVMRPISGEERNIYLQYERDYIAGALDEAVTKARDYLGFNPAPEWVLGESVGIIDGLAWNNQTYALQQGHISSIGKRATTLIQADVTVNFSDTDGDQIDDLATITISSTVATDEIGVFFRTADGATESASEYWQIDGLNVSASGGVVTITGHRGLFVHPANVWAKSYVAGDYSTKHVGSTTDISSFVAQVDIYRAYSDPTYAVELLLNPSEVSDGNGTAYATAFITDAKQGHVRLYTASGQDAPTATPYAVQIWYRAGYPLVNGHMDAKVERSLVRYANTLMPQQPAMNDRALDMWVTDRELIKQYNMTVASLNVLTALKPLRLALKATVSEWYPDALYQQG